MKYGLTIITEENKDKQNKIPYIYMLRSGSEFSCSVFCVADSRYKSLYIRPEHLPTLAVSHKDGDRGLLFLYTLHIRVRFYNNINVRR